MNKLILSIISVFFVFSFSYAQKPDMIKVSGGEFWMGSNDDEDVDNKPKHKVTVDDFYIATKEVTFDEFGWFHKSTGYPMPKGEGKGKDNGQLPVMNVSWEGAIKYCNWLSAKHRYDKVYEITTDTSGFKVRSVNFDANGYRLPTEAEWEYAALGTGGSQTNTTGEMAWYSGNSKGKAQPVGTSRANRLGLFDMQGNVPEWCWDLYAKDYYYNSPENNPKGAESGASRVYRGGGFSSSQIGVAIPKRYSLSPGISTGLVGFRLVRSKD